MSNELRRKIDEWIGRGVIGLCAAMVAVTGWSARQMYADLRMHSSSIQQLQAGSRAIDRSITRMASQTERAYARIDDHDRRLIRRESNAFTAQDANELSGNVARLAMQTSALSKDLEQAMQQITSMRKDIQELREAMIRADTLSKG